MDGALLAIRHARENAVPFLGTCGGFQHALTLAQQVIAVEADSAWCDTIARRLAATPPPA